MEGRPQRSTAGSLSWRVLPGEEDDGPQLPHGQKPHRKMAPTEGVLGKRSSNGELHARRSSSAGSGTSSVACPEFGPGWTKYGKARSSGDSQGRQDFTWVSPSGEVFRSRAAVLRHLGQDDGGMQMHAAARVGAASDHFADIDDEMDADEAEAFAAAEAAAEAEADAMAKELLGAEELLAGVTPADHLVKAVVAGSVTPAKTPLFIDPQLQLSDVIAPHYPAASALSEPDVGPADPEVRRSKREARPSMKHSDTTNDDDLAGGRAGGGGGASGVKSRQASGGGGGGAAKASAVASGGGKAQRPMDFQETKNG